MLPPADLAWPGGCRGYAALTEAELEDAYSQYQRRQGLRASAERKKRRRLGQATELDGNGSDSDEEAAPEDGPPAFAAAPADDDSEVGGALLSSVCRAECCFAGSVRVRAARVGSRTA